MAHPLAILLQGDATNAWRGAVFDDVVAAVLVIRLIGSQRAADAKAEFAVQPVQRRAQSSGVGKRAEVFRAIILLQPGETDARELITKVNPHEQEAFVIAEADIVTRTEFFDELAFQHQRLGIAAQDVQVKTPDAGDERSRFEVGLAGGGGQKVV